MTRAALALLAAAALAACGDTLVDHRADLRQGPGSNFCDAGQVSCHVDGADVCKEESATFCGEACADCAVGFVQPHAAAVPACLGTPGLGLCGYECTGGLLKCTGGCCSATELSAGAAHTCALAGGAAYCWGENARGQSGPVGAIVPLPLKRVDSGALAVAAGEAHTCVARQDDVVCFGRNDEGQAPAVIAIAGATALAAGLRHTCALVGGAVRCWGSGPGAGGADPVIPANASAIAAGADHTCALLPGGEVVCWGANDAGQLGNGTQVASATPVRAITPNSQTGARAITTRGNHSCAVLLNPPADTSTVLCWGDEPGTEFGLAAAQTTPAPPLDGGQPVIDRALQRVATGRTHVCFQRTGAESVECFGAESAVGQLGGVPVPPASPTESVDVPGTSGAVALAAGGDHGCVILATGGLLCWGSNASGQLGDGTTVTPGVTPDARPLGTPVTVSGR